MAGLGGVNGQGTQRLQQANQRSGVSDGYVRWATQEAQSALDSAKDPSAPKKMDGTLRQATPIERQVGEAAYKQPETPKRKLVNVGDPAFQMVVVGGDDPSIMVRREGRNSQGNYEPPQVTWFAVDTLTQYDSAK